jgi:hypothetical protein
VRAPRWVGGVGLAATGVGLQAGALRLAPLVVVQPIGVLAIGLTTVLATRSGGGAAGPPDRAGGGGQHARRRPVRDPRRRPDEHRVPGAVRACLLAGGLVATLGTVGARTPGRVPCLAFAAAGWPSGLWRCSCTPPPPGCRPVGSSTATGGRRGDGHGHRRGRLVRSARLRQRCAAGGGRLPGRRRPDARRGHHLRLSPRDNAVDSVGGVATPDCRRPAHVPGGRKAGGRTAQAVRAAKPLRRRPVGGYEPGCWPPLSGGTGGADQGQGEQGNDGGG